MLLVWNSWKMGMDRGEVLKGKGGDISRDSPLSSSQRGFISIY